MLMTPGEKIGVSPPNIQIQVTEVNHILTNKSGTGVPSLRCLEMSAMWLHERAALVHIASDGKACNAVGQYRENIVAKTGHTVRAPLRIMGMNGR